eukprot:193491-Chlamydomonas_euryale.AAC.1
MVGIGSRGGDLLGGMEEGRGVGACITKLPAVRQAVSRQASSQPSGKQPSIRQAVDRRRGLLGSHTTRAASAGRVSPCVRTCVSKAPPYPHTFESGGPRWWVESRALRTSMRQCCEPPGRLLKTSLALEASLRLPY